MQPELCQLIMQLWFKNTALRACSIAFHFPRPATVTSTSDRGLPYASGCCGGNRLTKNNLPNNHIWTIEQRTKLFGASLSMTTITLQTLFIYLFYCHIKIILKNNNLNASPFKKSTKCKSENQRLQYFIWPFKHCDETCLKHKLRFVQNSTRWILMIGSMQQSLSG